MEAFIHSLHHILVMLVEIGGTVLELFAFAVMMKTGVECFIEWIAHKHCGFKLAEGIALTLEFLLAAEVLHTVLAENVSDLIILGSLVVLRGLMTLEIHLEMKSEKEAEKEEAHEAG